MATQILLRITLPEGLRVYTSDFREMVARSMHEVPQARELFHYRVDGRPADGPPPARFVGARGWLGILTDEDHSDLLYAAMGPAVRAVTHLCGRAIPVEIERHESKVDLLSEPRRYWVREMAIKQRTDRSRQIAPTELVTDRLLAGLKRHAESTGVFWPGAERVGIDRVEIVKQRGMALRTTSGVTREYVGLFDVSFWANASFVGYWFAGNLTARGHGRVGLDLASLAQCAESGQRRERRAA